MHSTPDLTRRTLGVIAGVAIMLVMLAAPAAAQETSQTAERGMFEYVAILVGALVVIVGLIIARRRQL